MSNQDSAKKHSVKVSIMQREFTIACTEEESPQLIEAAAHLDTQMRTIAKGSQILGMDRCAIMAGLNISHELLQLKKNTGDSKKINSKLTNMHDKVDKAIEDFQQIGL
ncbi:MAG: cell division protein ZapA [Gammaproteobacteria bacterium]|nr:cell division protein ZapA [Gammaproteobacteria bacterium]NKB65390.1 cell division protein ZapA [Gammaproteobacteria bacterium]